MSEFNHIRIASDLPIPGTCEGPSLDFKSTLNTHQEGDRPDYKELAKDIAAFANATGGTILVPAHEADGRLSKYGTFDSSEAHKVASAYDEAAKTHCVPAVMTEVAHIKIENGIVVAINIAPSPAHPIGVKGTLGASDSPRGWPAFTFPVRIGRQTDFYDPTTLPIREHREKLLQVAQIPVGASVLAKYNNDNPGGCNDYVGNFVSLDVRRQQCRIQNASGPEYVIEIGDIASIQMRNNQWGGKWLLRMKSYARM